MSDAAGQPAHRLHLLRLQKLLFQMGPLRHIDDKGQDRRLVLPQDLAETRLDPDAPAILADTLPPSGYGKRGPLPRGRLSCLQIGEVLRNDQRLPRLADEI